MTKSTVKVQNNNPRLYISFTKRLNIISKTYYSDLRPNWTNYQPRIRLKYKVEKKLIRFKSF